MRIAKRLKSKEDANKYFYSNDVALINSLWFKSYGKTFQAINGKFYYISYSFNNGNDFLQVQEKKNK